MTVHIGFVELCTAVTADGKISNQATEVKMAVHIGFVKLCTAVTTDGDISNQAKEVKIIRGNKGQNATETRCPGFLVLESRCRVFSALESRCRGFSSSEKMPWNHDIVV